MIYELEHNEGFVISSGGAWLPGVFDSKRAARFAFRLSDTALQKLADRVCSVYGEARMIAWNDVKQAKESDVR